MKKKFLKCGEIINFFYGSFKESNNLNELFKLHS